MREKLSFANFSKMNSSPNESFGEKDEQFISCYGLCFPIANYVFALIQKTTLSSLSLSLPHSRSPPHVSFLLPTSLSFSRSFQVLRVVFVCVVVPFAS